jgi:hypothetical protein
MAGRDARFTAFATLLAQLRNPMEITPTCVLPYFPLPNERR